MVFVVGIVAIVVPVRNLLHVEHSKIQGFDNFDDTFNHQWVACALANKRRPQN